MTPNDALMQLLTLVGAAKGLSVYFSADDLARWPDAAVTAMTTHRLIAQARPAMSLVCPGCEQQCVRPVHVLPGDAPRAFLLCDKRTDINRVDIATHKLERWHASGEVVANLIACLLGIQRLSIADPDDGRWQIGVFRGKKHSSQIALSIDGDVFLHLAGHRVLATDVLALDSSGITINRPQLVSLVDQPVAGGGSSQVAEKRRQQLTALVEAEKRKGNRGFLKTVAGAQGISKSRLKQILRGPQPKPPKATKC